jgi:predicted dinucleotide-binding enzyme
MNIGIIGAGMVGGALARRLVQLGHAVSIANSRGPDTIRSLASEVGAIAVTVEGAAQAKALVIVAIPERAVPELPRSVFAALPAEVTVIDAGNYYPSRDGQIAAIDAGQTESGWVGEYLGRPVIKAFNTIYFKSVLEKGLPKGSPGRIALSVAGDPSDARGRVLRLVDELGFDPVDAGGIEESWRQQPGTPCYGKELDAARLKEALTAADKSLIVQYRKAADDAARAYIAQQKR